MSSFQTEAKRSSLFLSRLSMARSNFSFCSLLASLLALASVVARRSVFSRSNLISEASSVIRPSRKPRTSAAILSMRLILDRTLSSMPFARASFLASSSPRPALSAWISMERPRSFCATSPPPAGTERPSAPGPGVEAPGPAGAPPAIEVSGEAPKIWSRKRRCTASRSRASILVRPSSRASRASLCPPRPPPLSPSLSNCSSSSAARAAREATASTAAALVPSATVGSVGSGITSSRVASAAANACSSPAPPPTPLLACCSVLETTP
mmetsp:Transcript_114354/g.243918  ORF Transcript_114354/g.243918 Transcript_114354/m.243918 type:complete len:268 (+) Transcript_114354:633-1436(+)